MNRLAGFLVGFLLACTASSVTTPADAVNWRGAAVTGDHPHEAIATVLEPAWQGTPRDWEPIGWTITMHVDRFVCPGLGLARGCTDTRSGRRRIDLVAEVAVARWELCNARRWDQTGRLEDVGCVA